MHNTTSKVPVFGVFLVRIFIRTEYRDLHSTSPYSVQSLGNTDQKNSKYGHFRRSVISIRF